MKNQMMLFYKRMGIRTLLTFKRELGEAVSALRELNNRVHSGYDFNADPDNITLLVGDVLAKSVPLISLRDSQSVDSALPEKKTEKQSCPHCGNKLNPNMLCPICGWPCIVKESLPSAEVNPRAADNAQAPLPCPFCGGRANLVQQTDTDRANVTWIECSVCGAMSDDVFGDPKEKATALALELWNKRDFPSTGGKWRVERFADSVRIFDGRELLARFPLENWFDIKPNVIGLIEWHNNHLCAPGSGKCAGLASTANDSNPKSESVSASETRQEKGLRELIGRVMRHAHLTNGYRGDGQWQADINDLWDYVSGRSFLLATPTTREQPSEEIIYADGFCRRCSTLSYPLTRALEKVGVPTGADNWQQTWGPAKVLELEDYKNALRRLILAISGGDANDQKAALDNANFYFELHVKRYRERLKLAQREQQTPVREAQPSESALTPKGESQLAEEKWGAR